MTDPVTAADGHSYERKAINLDPCIFAPKAHLRSSAKRTIVSLRAVHVRVWVCGCVGVCVCNHTFGSVATSKVNGTANRLTRL